MRYRVLQGEGEVSEMKPGLFTREYEGEMYAWTRFRDGQEVRWYPISNELGYCMGCAHDGHIHRLGTVCQNCGH